MRRSTTVGAAFFVLSTGTLQGVQGAGGIGSGSVGTVSTLAGGAGSTASGYQDGVGTNALFNTPTSIAVDNAGLLAVIVSGYISGRIWHSICFTC